MIAVRTFCSVLVVSLACSSVAAQQSAPQQSAPQQPAPQQSAPTSGRAPQAAASVAVPGAIKPPDDYVIGVDDVLTIVFWRDKDMTADVTVRPDGKITLPLINDVLAAGLTPDQLREKVTAEAVKFIEDPAASVVLKQLNSRKVYITGEITKPGPYSLTSPTSVLQLIALAGGLRDYAHREDIIVMRTENGRATTFPFDYSAVSKGQKLQQNILLKPGDTVVVP